MLTYQDKVNNINSVSTTSAEDKKRAISLLTPDTPQTTGSIISGADLAPTKQYSVPSPYVSNTYPSAESLIGLSSNTIKTNAQNELDTALAEIKIRRDSTATDLKKTLSEILGTNTEIANAPATIDRTEANKAKQEVDNYTNQIEAEQLALRRSIEALSGKGITQENIGNKAEALTNESLRKQADLAILQNASVRRYDTATAIADTALKLKLEPLKAKLESLKFFYTENKDIFTKADDRVYSDLVKKADNELKKKEKEEESKTELIKNAIGLQAPASVLKKAQDVVSKGGSLIEVASALGSYAKDIDMELKKSTIAKNWADAKKSDTSSGNLTETQLKQIDNSPQGKKLVSLSGLYQKSQTYKNLVDLYGFRATGPEKAKMDQAYADLKIAYKEAANLGALTGPDVALLEEAIKPASGATNYLNYKISGGQGGVSNAIESALSKARAEALQNYKQLTARKPEYRGSDYVRSLLQPFSKPYQNSNIDSLPKGEIIETDDGILLESLGDGNFTTL